MYPSGAVPRQPPTRPPIPALCTRRSNGPTRDRKAAVRPCPENPAIAAPKGLLAKHRGTPECPGQPLSSGQPLSGSRIAKAIRGAAPGGSSSRRKRPQGAGDGTGGTARPPRTGPRPLSRAQTFGGPGRGAPFVPLGGLDMREALPADQSAPVGGCAGSYFSAQRAALFVFSCRECEPRFAWLSTASVWLKIG